MKVSFIGHGSAAYNTAKYLKEKGFELKGIYDKSHKKAVDMAIGLKCNAKFDLKKLIKESDIIFLADKEDNLKNLSYELTKFNLSDKIICILTKFFTSDAFEVFDTCFTVFPLKNFVEGEEYDLSNIKFVIEGTGKRYYHFIDELNEKNADYEIADANKKKAYLLVYEFATELNDALLSTVKDFLRNAKIYDEKFFEYLVRDNTDNYFKTPKDISYFDKALATGNLKEINMHFDAIDLYGNINTKALYKVMAYNIIEHGDLSQSEKERIRRIIYKK